MEYFDKFQEQLPRHKASGLRDLAWPARLSPEPLERWQEKPSAMLTTPVVIWKPTAQPIEVRDTHHLFDHQSFIILTIQLQHNFIALLSYKFDKLIRHTV